MSTSMQSYSPDTCMLCHQPLRIIAEPDFLEDEDELESNATDSEPGPPTSASTVIDDVEFYCGPPGSGPSGHHAHWTCLIDYAKSQSQSSSGPSSQVINSVINSIDLRAAAFCAVCGQNTLDASGRFIVDVRNEGGETRGFDFGEILEEELFLETHPDQVHARAFHDLVAEGAYEDAIQLMTEHHVDVNCTFGSDGLTALQKAMFSGDENGVVFLRGLGARG